MKNENSQRNWQQDKILTSTEIAKLKQAGFDIHELKNGRKASKKDLYKDKEGNIYVKLKGGIGEGEFTGLNINDF
jgi:hypothetical protein